MRLGIGSYTYVWSVGVPGYERAERSFTADDILDQAASLNVRLVQLCDNLPLDRYTAADLDRLAERARSLGISLEWGTSGIESEHLRRNLAMAVRVGSPLLRVVVDTPRSHPSPDDVVARLREIAPEFEKHNVVLAVENHDRFASPVLREMLDRIGSRHVGICFDTANSIGCLESAPRVLDVLGHTIVNVHVKDYSIFRPPHNKGFVVEGRPAGQGHLDIPALLERVKSFGRDPNVIVELWPPPQATLRESMELEQAWAGESVRYMRDLVPE